MTSSTVSIRVLVLSDTHDFVFDAALASIKRPSRTNSHDLKSANFESLSLIDNQDSDFASVPCPLLQPMPRVDVLIHCGDLTQVGGIPEIRKALHMLDKFDAELKLIIAGKHDLELDPAFDPDEPEDHAVALALMMGPEAKAAGVTYLSEGTHSFTLKNGAEFTVYSSPYQPAFGDWAFGYKHDEDRFNSPDNVAEGTISIAEHPIPDHVDIMITHGPPEIHFDYDSDASGERSYHMGCRNLARAVKRVRPIMHCFGHIHEGYGHKVVHWSKQKGALDSCVNTLKEASTITVTQVHGECSSREYALYRGESTLMVNAAIQTGSSEWRNAPFLVEVPLTRSS